MKEIDNNGCPHLISLIVMVEASEVASGKGKGKGWVAQGKQKLEE